MSRARCANPILWLVLNMLGFGFCIIPPMVCTLSYFPVWRLAGYEECVAGGSALLLVLCLIPLFKLVRRAFTSYSSYMIWLIMFLLFFALSKIAAQMTVISLVGFIGNLIGAVLFSIARKFKGKETE